MKTNQNMTTSGASESCGIHMGAATSISTLNGL